MNKIIFSMMILLVSVSARAAVWENENTWTEEWQNRYSEWIAEDFTEDIFVKGPWKGLVTDCADAAYSARVIFSANNHLPFVIKNPSGSGFVSNQTSQFDGISNPHQRVLAFVRYINRITGTETLPNDTYPIAINRNAVKPGVIWLRASIASQNALVRAFDPNYSPGHAETVTSVDDTGIVHMIASTVPPAVRPLARDSSFEYPPFTQHLGLRAWILPQNEHLPMSQQPNYSLEQYSMGIPPCNNNREGESGFNNSNNCNQKATLQQFQADVQARLALHAETAGEAVSRHVQEICSLATARVDDVDQALKHRSAGCFNKDEYDDFSTPNRDARIKQLAKEMASEAGSGLFHSASSTLDKISGLSQCPDLQIAPGRTLSLKEFLKNVLSGNISSDPNQSVDVRWGLAPAEHRCSTY